MIYRFEGAAIELGGVLYYCDGEIEYEVEDNAVGWVPYGDTQVWHPGDGDSVDAQCVDVTSVTDEDGNEMSVEPRTLEDAIVNDLEKDMIEYAKKRHEEDKAAYADTARKARWEDD